MTSNQTPPPDEDLWDGKLAAARLMLNSALKLMLPEQIEAFHDVELGFQASMAERHLGTSFLEGFMEEHNRLTFRIGQALVALDGDEGDDANPDTPKHLHLLCIKCEMPVPYISGVRTVCPACGSAKSIEVIR